MALRDVLSRDQTFVVKVKVPTTSRTINLDTTIRSQAEAVGTLFEAMSWDGSRPVTQKGTVGHVSALADTAWALRPDLQGKELLDACFGAVFRSDYYQQRTEPDTRQVRAKRAILRRMIMDRSEKFEEPVEPHYDDHSKERQAANRVSLFTIYPMNHTDWSRPRD
ncbi:hypothetical protein M231_07026 [Tremella mesenterica]|uniref:Uncharacterized protein n=1 Tax=Tremella mesenterica TaxID=5217 RepID=A0A4Q1BA95_TREME|nr:hypothetical protein M231_07026 [Tremella mesenterica]